MTTQRIAIIAPNWIGDVIMAQSLLMTLKQQQTCKLSVYAPKAFGSIVKRMPEVACYTPTEFPRGKLHLKARRALGHSMANQYDQCIILPNSFKSALPAYWAKIPQRTGWVGELRYPLLNDARKLNPKTLPTMVQRFVALAYPKNHALQFADCPKPKLEAYTNNINEKLADKKIAANDDRPIIAFCPGAAYGPAKRWPEQHYASLAEQCLKQGYAVWIFGGPQEQPLAATIQTHCKQQCVDWTGQTTLDEAIDLMAQCNLTVSNDSGLMHLASALSMPVIAIYGPTASTFAPPLCQKGMIVEHKNLPCRPCKKRTCPLQHHQCMQSITPKSLLTIINNQLESCTLPS
jgi:heptosyltransferase II